MTVDVHEQGDGSPERLFLFSVGSVNYAYLEGAEVVNRNGIDYEPLALIKMDDIEQALSEDSPTVEIEIDSKAPMVNEFIPYQPVTVMRVRVFRHHVEDEDNEYTTELIGDVVSARIDESSGNAVVSVRMVASAFDRVVPWPSYGKQCVYVPYGPGCQVDRNLFKTETTLTAVVGNKITSPDFAAKAALESDPRWFVLGYVVRVADGQRRWVIRQDDDVLTLQNPFIGATGGDEVEAFAGDDLLKSTCEGKFNNLDRHMAFPWGPQKNPFTDNIMGTGSPAGSGGSANSGRSTTLARRAG